MKFRKINPSPTIVKTNPFEHTIINAKFRDTPNVVISSLTSLFNNKNSSGITSMNPK